LTYSLIFATFLKNLFQAHGKFGRDLIFYRNYRLLPSSYQIIITGHFARLFASGGLNQKMEKDNNPDIYRKLEKQFQDTDLCRPMKIERYEAGTELEYDVTGLTRAAEGRVRLYVDKFVGGGFAGQVYRVKVLKVESENLNKIIPGMVN